MRRNSWIAHGTEGSHWEQCHFVVVCSAAGVSLVGDFNGWSTTATPMTRTDENVWQITLRLRPGQGRFGFFLVNRDVSGGSGTFEGSTYLPGNWASVTATPQSHGLAEDLADSRLEQTPFIGIGADL
jgi:Carbohydrate-binding module 48 (Isoamylase N-terminal domain)